MTTKRESLINKILALRAKTLAAGATEAEAMSAAAKASELMMAYEVEEAELAQAEERAPSFDIGEDQHVTQGRNLPKVWLCGHYLQKLTRCQSIRESVYGGFRIKVTGDRPDRELFLYLFETIDRAMEEEYAAYAKKHRKLGRGAKASFQLGMASRINERLKELIASRQVQTTGQHLVLVDTKTALVQAAFQRAYPKLRSVSSSYHAGNGGAYSAGKEAGGRVALGRSLPGSNKRIT